MYPTHYIEFLAHFHGTRDYFECHEVLEEYWKKTDRGNRDSVWVFLIQTAVCMYHYRRGNMKGALTLIKRCRKKADQHSLAIDQLGLDSFRCKQLLEALEYKIKRNVPYTSIQLPISDPELMIKTKALCHEWNVEFGSVSDLSQIELIEKHRFRSFP